MSNFRATFKNASGLRLTLSFRNPNWCGVEDAARRALGRQSEHTPYGPWEIYSIDVTA